MNAMIDRPKPGIRRADLKPCACCGKGLMHSNKIDAYRVEISQYIADHRAIQQQHGLELMIGNAAIAQVMGTDPEFFKHVSTSAGLVCSDCFMDFEKALCEIWEQLGKRQEAE